MQTPFFSKFFMGLVAISAFAVSLLVFSSPVQATAMAPELSTCLHMQSVVKDHVQWKDDFEKLLQQQNAPESLNSLSDSAYQDLLIRANRKALKHLQALKQISRRTAEDQISNEAQQLLNQAQGINNTSLEVIEKLVRSGNALSTKFENLSLSIQGSSDCQLIFEPIGINPQ